MKRVVFSVLAILMAVMSASAQVKIESPHPDLDIQVKRCAMASGTVVIDLLVTNYGDEEVVTFLGSYNNRSTAYDDEGNKYANEESSIKVWFSGESLTFRHHNVVLPREVPIKARIQVDKVSPQASKFLLLKFGVESKGAMALNVSKPIQIRNLQWSK